MNNKFKFIPLCLFSISLLTGCSLEARPEDTTALMTAINYADNTRITYQGDDEYYTPGWSKDELEWIENDADLKDKGARGPQKISKGDYKPVFAAIQKRLNIKLLEHQGAACSGEKKSVSYFRDNWLQGPYADMSMGTVYAITNYSVAGDHETILDLKPYLDQTKFDEWGHITEPGPLPHIALFLRNNPAVKMSVTTAKHSLHSKGAIYYIPYFDGFNDLEKMPIVRADLIERVLDNNPDDTFSDDISILGKDGKYKKNFEPCYADSDGNTKEYTIEYPAKESDTWVSCEYIKKSKSKDGLPIKNIIVQQNELIEKNEASSKALAQQFRNYIDARYGPTGKEGGFFKNYSDLFLDYEISPDTDVYKACYDADELVALMRLIKVSSGTIFGKDENGKWINKEMIPMMPRELDNSNSADLYRWAGQLFGCRGFESRNDYLYLKDKINYQQYDSDFKNYDKVNDCRGDESTVELLKKLNNLYKEGLILQEFDTNTATGTPNGKFCDDSIIGGGSDNYCGFMIYDYPNFSDKFNSDPKSDKWRESGHDYNLRPMINAVAHWETGNDGIPDPHDHDGWMRFTESWCSIKTSGLCLNAKLPETPEKLAAAFKFVDYIYSDEGKFLYNYGPWEDGYMYPYPYTEEQEKRKGLYKFVEYQGKKIPQFTEEAISFNNKDSNHLRRKVGATIPFSYEKLKGMEVQNYSRYSRDAIDEINRFIETKSLLHVLTDYDPAESAIRAFYKIVPSAFFLTTGQSSAIANLRDKAKLGSIFTDSSQNNFNIWDSYVMGKKSSIAPDLSDYLNTINNKWDLPKLVKYYQSGYEAML